MEGKACDFPALSIWAIAYYKKGIYLSIAAVYTIGLSRSSKRYRHTYSRYKYMCILYVMS